MKFGQLALVLCVALVGISEQADGAAVLVTDPAQLQATDQLNWAALGPSGTVVPSPFPATTVRGLGVTVSTGGDHPSFKRLDQGNGFSGDFAPGTPLLATNSLGPVHITFPQPVLGVGTFLEHATLGTFQQYVRALSGKTVVAEFVVDETNNHLGNGTAGFIGVLSDQTNITDVYFDSFEGGNTVSSGPLIAVPLPSGLYVGVLVLPAVLFWGRRMRRFVVA